MLRSSESNWLCDPVCVNVGGVVYTTTLDTLTRCRDSMLGAMFTGQIPLLRDKQGNVFIDRDGKVFRYILNYLRCNSVDLPWDSSELALLRREADFFQIHPLLVELERREAELQKRPSRGALLCVDVDSVARVLHFNYKRGPENYELRSCTVHVHTANVFCTSQTLIQLLCKSFSYKRGGASSVPQAENMDLHLEWVPCPPELPHEQHLRHGYQELCANLQHDGTAGVPVTTQQPNGTASVSANQQPNRTASVSANQQPNGTASVSANQQPNGTASVSANQQPNGTTGVPDGTTGVPVTDTRSFIAQLLRLVLAEGFRVDLVTPDPADILNCHRLRCVRY